jgi:hypothetical protein
MIVDTMTGKDIVGEFNRDIDSIDKIAERMAVKKRRILLKMKNQMTFPHFAQMKVGNNRYYLVWKCLSRNSLNYTVFTKCGKRIYAYSTDTTVLEFTRHFLDRYNERFKIVGLDNILRNICKDFCLGKIFDSTVVTDTGLFIMTETDYGFSAVTCMNDLSMKNNLERLEKIRKGLSILDPKSKDEEIMQLYKLGLYEDPLMSL